MALSAGLAAVSVLRRAAFVAQPVVIYVGVLDFEAVGGVGVGRRPAFRNWDVEYLPATAAYKMRVWRGVAVVMDVSAVDCQHRQRIFLFEKRQGVVDGGFRQGRHHGMKVAIYCIDRRVGAVFHQVSHYGDPLNGGLYVVAPEMLYYVIHFLRMNDYKFEIITKLQ